MKLFKLLIVTMIILGWSFANGQRLEGNIWTLQECVDYAIENNLTIARDRLSVQNSEVTLQQNKAGIYPTLNAGAGTGFNWGRSIDPTTNDFITQRIGTTGFSANSSVILFNRFNLQNRVRQSKVDLEASKRDLEKTRNDILFGVISLYTSVIFNKELLENAKSQLNSIVQQVDRTQKQVNAGALPKSNLLNLLSQQATIELNIVNAENNLNFVLLQLKQLLQIPATDPFDIEIPEIDVETTPIIDITAQEVYQLAVQSLPEVKSADLGVESSLLGMEISKAGFFPMLRLNAGMGTNYSDARTSLTLSDGTSNPIDLDNDGINDTQSIGFVQGTNQTVLTEIRVPNFTTREFDFSTQLDENLTQNIGLNLSIPIFNGLQARSNLQRSIITNKQAEITAEQVRNTLRQNIENAYNDVYAASKSYAQSLVQVEALEESFRITEQRYNLNAVSFVDYQVASDNLFQASSDLLRAKYDYIFKQKILDFYQGKTLSFN